MYYKSGVSEYTMNQLEAIEHQSGKSMLYGDFVCRFKIELENVNFKRLSYCQNITFVLK